MPTERRLDITGFKHPTGKLTAKTFSHINKKGQAVWNSLCDCGATVKIECWLIHNGHVKSCGCIRLEATVFECWGEGKTKRQWAADPRCKVEYFVLKHRLYIGWGIEKALTTPLLRIARKNPEEPKAIAPSGRGIPLKELLLMR